MRQAIMHGVGKELAVEDKPDPQPAAGEVQVALKAAALNHRDVWITQGLYPGITCPLTPGSDGAGLVAACGDGVDASWLGREVIINPAFDWGDNERAQGPDFSILGLPKAGTHATHVCVPVGQVVDKPAHLDWGQAAALPLAGLTAYRALFVQGQFHEGDTVLINGVGGGVAGFAMQFALTAGATVIVTSSSAEKRARAVAMGAMAAYDYHDDHWAQSCRKEQGGFHIAIDGAAGVGMNALIDCAKPGARIILYGGTAGLPHELNIRPVFWKQLGIQGSTMGSPRDFAAMLSFVSEHRIEPLVDQRFPLSEVNAAYERMEHGQQFGKIVLEM